MAVSKRFVAHALDLLQLAGPVRTRAMFGGVGLYLGDAMFGLLDDDELFLKADEETRQRFVAAGCLQWVYRGAKGPIATAYYRPPDAALDDPESMLEWARLAQAAAGRAQLKKQRKARQGQAGSGSPRRKKRRSPSAK